MVKEGVTDAERLARLLRTRHPLISIVTSEEAEALGVVREAARSMGCQVWRWSVLEGIVDDGREDGQAEPDTETAAGALYWLSRQPLPSVGVTLDLADHLGDARALRALRHLLNAQARTGGQLVMIDHAGTAPDVVRAHATPLELTLPDEDAVEGIVRRTLRELHRERPIRIELTSRDYRVIIKNLLGLTVRQAEQVIRDAVCEDRVLSAEDLNSILASKRRMVSSSGLLEYVESPASLDDVGGMGRLKEWLRQRARSFEPEAREFGVRPPRGVLLLGVQGAGKSLCAKAIATAWQRPLLRMDPGVLYNRYVGETERRLREALHHAEAMAPVVLWVDEIEKAFASAASQSTDGGLSQRMFGTLLTWMQDHEAPVFLVATANNIEALPPELLRKGRFDEVFFVDLPSEEARRMIFSIHLRRRGRDPSAFDLDSLSAAAEGYSGAEIEEAVNSAMHAALDAGGEPTTAMIVRALEESPPLSVTMRERVERLRQWARGRCVPAE